MFAFEHNCRQQEQQRELVMMRIGLKTLAVDLHSAQNLVIRLTQRAMKKSQFTAQALDLRPISHTHQNLHALACSSSTSILARGN
jgi:hypothetical protein